MKATTTLPDLAQSFARLKTMLDLEEQADQNTLLGIAIVQAIRKKTPNAEIIRMLKEQIKDNRRVVIDCTSLEIVESIENNWPEIIENDPMNGLIN